MRTWPGLAAVGAGLIHLGVAAGSAPLLLAAFAAVGSVEVLWGVLALARPPVPLNRGALAGALLLVAATGTAILLPAATHRHGGGTPAVAAVLPDGALLGAAALDLAVAVAAAVVLRRGPLGDPPPMRLRQLPALVLGAALVALVTATSLAGTAVGAHHAH